MQLLIHSLFIVIIISVVGRPLLDLGLGHRTPVASVVSGLHPQQILLTNIRSGKVTLVYRSLGLSNTYLFTLCTARPFIFET